VGIAYEPLRRPAWVEVRIEDGALPAATYRIQATVVDAQGRESAACAVQIEGSALPHGLTARLPYAPEGAAGWNLYLSDDGGATGLQNAAPLGLAEEWTLPLTGVITGRPPGEGQAADEVVRASGSVLLRG